LNISKPTLRANFGAELREARRRKYVENLVRLDKAAAAGSIGAMKFLAGVFSAGGVAPLSGKKAAREEAAKQALSHGPWADLLNPETYQQ
jgi:hypothetical protein